MSNHSLLDPIMAPPDPTWENPNGPLPPPGHWTQAKSSSKKVYVINRADTILGLALVVMGFLTWNWLFPRSRDTEILGEYFYVTSYPGVAVTIFVFLALACSLIYFAYHKVKLSLSTVIGAIILLLAGIPFSLYDSTPVHLFAGLALVFGYITWHCYAARSAISSSLSTNTVFDLTNQSLLIPFANIGAWFAALKPLARARTKPTRLIAAILGIVISIPLVAGVLALLMAADTSFSNWMSQVGDWFAHISLGQYFWQFFFAIPVAIYWFAILYGNAYRRDTRTLTTEVINSAAQSARKINQAAIVAPTLILCAIYLVFFASMGSYLFSAFNNHLPGGFSYAQYARRGFFELAGVAAINLVVLGFTYLFVKRTGDNYPSTIRVFGGILSGMTVLLILIAGSKMVLYVNQYGLTQLRIYILWFLAVLFIIFTLFGIWHIRQFRVGTWAATVLVIAFLALSWANTDGLIADYNVNGYLNGKISSIDPEYLSNDLSDAAIPALIKLQNQATDEAVQAAATTALKQNTLLTEELPRTWTSWNWQSHQAIIQLK